MKNIYIYCEGQTEEAFVNELITPYFLNRGFFIYPIICITKQSKGRKYKGGVSSYQKIKNELTKIAKGHPHEHVTTMFDFYGMPDDTPGIGLTEPDLYKKISFIEARINEDIGAVNCHFHFMVHEFEGLLFSDTKAFETIAEESVVNALSEMRSQFPNPEYINTSVETAPSKRILNVIPNYGKVRHGAILSQQIGIDRMMEECPHFRSWIEQMKSYG